MKKSELIYPTPGEKIKERLAEIHMTQKEMCARLNMTEKHISKLINGEVLLTQEMAYALEMVLGLPAYYWLDIEAKYRQEQQKTEELKKIQKEAALLSHYPMEEMAALGWLENQKTNVDRVIQMRKYFEVANLAYLNNSLYPNVLCKRNESTTEDYALVTWAQKAKIESHKIHVSAYSPYRCKSRIRHVAAMIREQRDLDRIPVEFSQGSICVVTLPKLKDLAVDSTCFRTGQTNVIVISDQLQGDAYTKALFRELGHIYLDHAYLKTPIGDKEEKEVDEFVKEMLG